MSAVISPGQLRGPLSNPKWFLARRLKHFPEAMSTHCQRLSFSASFSFFPCVCGCVDLCGEREKQYRQGEVKKLSSEGQLATQGLIVFLSLPRRQKKGPFFSLPLSGEKLTTSPALSLSRFLWCTPWLLFTSWCLLNVTYFTWGTLWRWGIRSNQGYYPCGAMSGPDALRHPSSGWPLLQCATSRGIKWHYGGSGCDGNSMGSAGRTLLSLGLKWDLTRA